MTTREGDLERLKKFAWEKRRGKDFWERFTVDLLERVWLRVNKENFLRYGIMKGVLTKPCAPNLNIPARIRQKIRQGAGLEKWHGAGQCAWMSWKYIGKCADALGVPMELLVDEDYYFARWGLAGYRVLCEAYRKGMSMKELTYLEGVSDNPRYSSLWYYTWYCFFLSKDAFFKGRFQASFFSQVICVCRERLGVSLGTLVGKQLHTTSAVGPYGELCNILAALGDRECALLAAVAKALHDYKFGCEDAGEQLTQDINKLLRWYVDGADKKNDEAARG